MRRNRWEILTLAAMVALAALAFFGPAIWAQTAGKYYRTESRNTAFRGDIWVSGTSEQAFAWNDVTVTSPTTAISVDGKGAIRITTDANMTGYTLTGGENGQVVPITSGAGSNTIRFDDGSSYSLGANVTLTEGQHDVLVLQCVNDDGDEWMALYAHDN